MSAQQQREPTWSDPRRMRAPTTQELAGMKGWAWRLRRREIDGDQLGICQRRFWREALGLELAGTA